MAWVVNTSACWSFRVGEGALIDPGRRFGESISRRLGTEDISVTKMIEMMLGLVRGHVDSVRGLKRPTSLNN